eukprot:8273-Heterococcus_DN1.PRE.2
MDGFDSNAQSSNAQSSNGQYISEDITKRVVVIAATNRPEVLDPALTRPGRFDRHVNVGLPDEAGRVRILRVHIRKVAMSSDISLTAVARQTAGFSGAELANVVNEAALLAVRSDANTVQQQHMQAAIVRAKAYRKMYSADYHTMLQVD